uniref:Uncharacterized protein n=1 Tax=Amphimedon queenslandica TaxID=400682 RepID=A0A1X7UPE8_AMPQE
FKIPELTDYSEFLSFEFDSIVYIPPGLTRPKFFSFKCSSKMFQVLFHSLVYTRVT